MSTSISGTPGADVYQWAARLTAGIRPADTTYSYPTPAVHAPLVAQTDVELRGLGCDALAAAPAARTDCSGWVSWLVQAAARGHFDDVQAYRDSNFAEDPCPWPRANVWYQYFLNASNPGRLFQVVEPFTALQPGDIIAWALDEFASRTSYLDKGGDTGHIMVVLDPAPRFTPAVARPAGTETMVSVAVSDSSSVPHASGGGYTDARDYGRQNLCGPLDHGGGVGAGVITFALDGRGRAVQFCFNAANPENHFFAPGTNQHGNPALIVARPV
jgi:hypothetical protein